MGHWVRRRAVCAVGIMLAVLVASAAFGQGDDESAKYEALTHGFVESDQTNGVTMSSLLVNFFDPTDCGWDLSKLNQSATQTFTLTNTPLFPIDLGAGISFTEATDANGHPGLSIAEVGGSPDGQGVVIDPASTQETASETLLAATHAGQTGPFSHTAVSPMTAQVSATVINGPVDGSMEDPMGPQQLDWSVVFSHQIYENGALISSVGGGASFDGANVKPLGDWNAGDLVGGPGGTSGSKNYDLTVNGQAGDTFEIKDSVVAHLHTAYTGCVPESSSLLLFAGGALGTLACAKRRRLDGAARRSPAPPLSC